MTREEIINEIEINHKRTTSPTLSKVLCGSMLHIGFFQDFDDANELKEQGKYRFINNPESSLFRAELVKTGKPNPKYSVVIDVKDIAVIKLVNSNNDFTKVHTLQEMGYKESEIGNFVRNMKLARGMNKGVEVLMSSKGDLILNKKITTVTFTGDSVGVANVINYIATNR